MTVMMPSDDGNSLGGSNTRAKLTTLTISDEEQVTNLRVDEVTVVSTPTD